MKISIKLNKDEAGTLVIICKVHRIQPLNRHQRVQLSIIQEVVTKIQRFYLGFNDDKKPRKINLKIYEADMLELYFASILGYITNDYSNNVIRKVIAEINQQLV